MHVTIPKKWIQNVEMIKGINSNCCFCCSISISYCCCKYCNNNTDFHKGKLMLVGFVCKETAKCLLESTKALIKGISYIQGLHPCPWRFLQGLFFDTRWEKHYCIDERKLSAFINLHLSYANLSSCLSPNRKGCHQWGDREGRLEG